jgi:hypothetical protein
MYLRLPADCRRDPKLFVFHLPSNAITTLVASVERARANDVREPIGTFAIRDRPARGPANVQLSLSRIVRDN